MSLQTPTTVEINDTIIAQLEASLSQTIPLLPRSFLRVLARTLAGVFVLLYKYTGFMFLQLFVNSASFAETEINGQTVNPLLEWGRLVGVGDPAAAVQAEYTVTVTVENQTGTLPAGSQLLGPGNGVTYLTLAPVLLNAPTVTVAVRAVSDQTGGDGSGPIGNLDVGAIMSFANPLANVARDAVVATEVVRGANGESEAVYRQRVIDRFQARPQGGALADYRAWGEEPAGIVNVYPYTSDCPGTVDVFVEATVASSGNADGIPTAAQLQQVKDAIELDASGLATRRPANALVTVSPITRVAFNVTIQALQVTDLASVQTEVTEALTEYFATREPFLFGLDVPPRRDRITATSVAGVIEDVVTTRGGLFTGIVLRIGTTVTNLYTLDIGQKAKLDTVEFL